ncbi:MFS transporter, partial [Cupriavidus basilensis]|uniref:MFS transporter n=1 Tax=Cupriavidus basilensis TaxID=68895 RepID=UPI003C2C226C
VLSNYGELLRDRVFVGYSLSAGCAQAGMFAYIAGSPFVLIELHGIDPSHYGLVFGANALGLIGMSQLNARLVRNRTLDHVLRGALVAPCLAGLALAAAVLAGLAPLPVLLAGFFVFIASLGCILPNASALAMDRQGHRAGTASALMGTLQFSLGTLDPGRRRRQLLARRQRAAAGGGHGRLRYRRRADAGLWPFRRYGAKRRTNWALMA